MPITLEQIQERFKHHPPRNQAEINVHEGIRGLFLATAATLLESLPEGVVQSREFAQVLTDLENGMMHCNQAYALHKGDE